MSETKFQVGDVCTYQGCEGVITAIDLREKTYPITAVFNEDEGQFGTFTLDGRHNIWHKEPSLKLIERPKKKVPKTMYQAICRYPTSGGLFYPVSLYRDEDHAKKDCGSHFYALGPAITFEVEE